jgi:hypothetical protein
MENFNLKKFLVENKLTTKSKLQEGIFSRTSKEKSTSITLDDLKKSKYYDLLEIQGRGRKYKEVLIGKVLEDINKSGSSLSGKALVDEVVTFITRILRNYDSMPSENQYRLEYTHFLK